MSGHKNKSAAECIGFRYGWDVRDVNDVRYQAGKQKFPVYSMFGGYVCCPPAGEQPPVDREIPNRWEWVPDGQAFGRQVYFARAGAEPVNELVEGETATIVAPGTKFHGRVVLVVKFLDDGNVHIRIDERDVSIERSKLKG